MFGKNNVRTLIKSESDFVVVLADMIYHIDFSACIRSWWAVLKINKQESCFMSILDLKDFCINVIECLDFSGI